MGLVIEWPLDHQFSDGGGSMLLGTIGLPWTLWWGTQKTWQS